MDFFDLVKLMARWWFVTVPMMILTLVATAALSDRIDPEFTARGSMILAVPSTGADAEDGGTDATVANPLLSINGALPTTAYVTALSIGSPQVASILAEEGYSTSYDVAAEARMPIILLETRAPTREMATNTALRLIDLVDNDLQLRQDAADVPGDDRVTADVISVAVVGGADYGGRTRMRIVLLGLGLGATVGAVFVLEGLRQRRRLAADGTTADRASDSESTDLSDDEVEPRASAGEGTDFDNGVNNVDIDAEMTTLATNDLSYRMATRLLSMRYNVLRGAIKGQIR